MKVSGVYFIQTVIGGPVKIGGTCDLLSRIKTLQSSCPFELKFVGIIKHCNAINVFGDEGSIHENLNAYRLHGEYFDDAPYLYKIINDCGDIELCNKLNIEYHDYFINHRMKNAKCPFLSDEKNITRKQIYDFINENEYTTLPEICIKLVLYKSTARNCVTVLKNKGYIKETVDHKLHVVL
jgi:hypothetical protein